MVVYCATNKVNGHRYVGSTKNYLATRRVEHGHAAKIGSNGCAYFYKALRYYGLASFEWSVLAKAKTVGELRDLETSFILTLRPEYNVSKSGRGGSGHFSPEGLAKISATSTGNQYRLGKKHSRKTRELLKKYARSNSEMWLKYRHLGPTATRRAILNEKTGAVFASRSQAAVKLGVSRTRVLRILEKRHSDLVTLPLRYLTKLECVKYGVPFNPPDPWSEDRRKSFTKKKQYQCKPVICLEDSKSFASLQLASDYYGFDATKAQINNAHYAIRRGWQWFGKRFSYSKLSTNA